MRAAASAAAAEAIQVALQPIQQSFAFFQQREEKRSLPPIQKPPFAAVHTALQLLPSRTQEDLQPFYLALRAADTVDNEQQAVAAVEPLLRFCLDHPAATAQDLKQQEQLLSASSQVNPFINLLSGNPTNFLQLLGAASTQAAQQASQGPSVASQTTSTNTPCFKCGLNGHLASNCTRALNRDGQPIGPGQLKFAPSSWRTTYNFDGNGFKRK